MKKGFFFSLPSSSVHNTLFPVALELAFRKFDITYYNSESFMQGKECTVKAVYYPEFENGYDTRMLNGQTSYFDFAEMLVNTSSSIFEFLKEQVEKEKPDFVVHSHLALWGKLLSERFNLPAVTLYSTFVLAPQIMLPFFRQKKNGEQPVKAKPEKVLALHRKYQQLYSKIGITSTPDIWDAYVNKGKLNISFILPQFQPAVDILDNTYKFLGYPLKIQSPGVKRNLIYISMGTIFNDDVQRLKACLNVLQTSQYEIIVSIGNKISMEELGTLSGNISVLQQVDQLSILSQAEVFITQGGMASVHESISTLTPMIVIPQIPEQQITAMQVEHLGIGVHIPVWELSEDRLQHALKTILEDHAIAFRENLRTLKASWPKENVSTMACNYIEYFFQSV